MKFKSYLSFFYFVILAGVLLFGCGSQSGFFESSSGSISKSNPRVKAPNFNLRDINGKNFSLASLKGKVIFLDFWATWCPPCVWSSPQVEALAEKYSGKKLEVISISLDTSEDQVRRFFEGKTVKTRVALAGDSGVEVQYRVSGIPAFFLIDQEGYLAKRWGGFNENLPNIWKKEIDILLKI